MGGGVCPGANGGGEYSPSWSLESSLSFFFAALVWAVVTGATGAGGGSAARVLPVTATVAVVGAVDVADEAVEGGAMAWAKLCAEGLVTIAACWAEGGVAPCWTGPVAALKLLVPLESKRGGGPATGE